MKVHVADIEVPDCDLMRDIVHALENSPRSGNSYEIEMRQREAFDLNTNRPTGHAEWHLRIHRHESV
jgi:hypothetical protein